MMEHNYNIDMRIEGSVREMISGMSGIEAIVKNLLPYFSM